MTNRNRAVLVSGAAAILAAVGMAHSAHAIGVTAPMVYLWTGQDYGAGVGKAPGALPFNGGPTPVWTWKEGSQPTQPWIDENGRVYFQGAFTSSIATPVPIATTVFGVFNATNHTNLSMYQNWAVGQADPNTGNMQLVNNAGTSSGIGNSSFFRISGSAVGLGVQIGNAAGTGTNAQESQSGTGPTALLQNNMELYSGNLATQNFLARQSRLIATPNSSDWTAAPSGTTNYNDITNYRTALSQQSSDMNTSGTILANIAFAVQGPNQATVAATGVTGNASALALIGAGGATTVVARVGDLPFGATGPQFRTIGGGLMKMARNGQVVYDANFLNIGTTGVAPGPGGVTTTNDSTAWIYTPGSGAMNTQHSQIYQEGNNVPTRVDPISGLTTSNGTATWTGSINTNPNGCFSNAGMIWTGTPTGGDTVSTGTNPNDQFLMISTSGGGLTPTTVIRKNDIAPGYSNASDVHLGSTNNSSLHINNSGMVSFGATLQSANITNPTAVINPIAVHQTGGIVDIVGKQGNEQAVFAGTPGVDLRVIARKGDLAPGFSPPRYILPTISGLNLNMNNSGDVVFVTGVSKWAAGDTIGTVGQTATSISAEFDTTSVLWSWNSTYGLVNLLKTGQLVEVDTGIFKYVTSFQASGVDNGDGGSMSLNDAGQLVVHVRVSDSFPAVTNAGTAYIVLQVPAPGTGALALLGLGAMARRRRR